MKYNMNNEYEQLTRARDLCGKKSDESQDISEVYFFRALYYWLDELYGYKIGRSSPDVSSAVRYIGEDDED